MRLALALLGTSLAAAPASGEAPARLSWLVLPARAAHPPPQDPTLLRLSKPVAEAFAELVSGPVRLGARGLRDARCRDDGWRCPDEIAALLGVDRVVSMQLDDDYGALTLYVFAERRGVVAKVSLPCAWDAGRLSCRTEGLAKLAHELEPRGLEPAVVFAAYEALEPKLRACLGPEGAEAEARVRLSVAPSGRAHSVRIEPRRLQRRERYACVARALEGLEVPPFAGADAGPFTFALPGAASADAEP